MARQLTDKQRLWVEAYLETWNATEAAKQAGYNGSYDTIRAIGSQNLSKSHLKAAIEERLTEAAMSANEVLARIARIARGEFGQGFSITTGEMLRALELLAKHHALLTDKIKVEDWRTEVVGLLRSGALTPEEVKNELGSDLAAELFESAGVPVGQS